MPYNSGAKSIFFGSTVIVYNYFCLCIVAERLKYIYIYLCVHTAFEYFNIFSSCLFSHSLSPSTSLFLHADLHEPSHHRPIAADPRFNHPSPSTHILPSTTFITLTHSTPPLLHSSPAQLPCPMPLN